TASPRGGINSALRRLRRQLVRQLGPQLLDYCPHFIGDVVNPLDIEHVLVEALQARRQHDLAADQAGLIDAPLSGDCRLLSADAEMAFFNTAVCRQAAE